MGLTAEIMKFKIKYYFDGYGSVEVEAKNREKAEEMFFDGEFENEEEHGDQYTIDTTEEA